MILDIMYGGFRPGVSESNYGFTADNATVSQPIASIGPPPSTTQFYSTISHALRPVDNFLIVAAMLACPHGYQLGGPDFPIFDLLLSQGATHKAVNSFGSNGYVRFPALNQWVELNQAISLADYFTSGNTQLRFTSVAGSVSQAGMPAVLNAQVIRVTPVIKIIHNIALGL